MEVLLKEVDGPSVPNDPTNIKFTTVKAKVGGVDVITEATTVGYVDDAFEFHPYGPANPMRVAPAAARNTFGSVTSVAMTATVAVVTYVADAAFKLRGIVATGTGDGAWRVKYGSTIVYAARTCIADQAVVLVLPNPDAAAAGQTVTVEVTNNGTGVADFECTVLGE